MVVVSSAGHSGAASATWEHVHRHFAVAALFVARNAACTSGGPKIDSHVDFDLTAAWRHHVSMLPSSRSQSAATTALAGGTCELFRVKRLREIPHWWILGRCGPPSAPRARARACHYARARARTPRARPRTPAHARARPRTSAHAALRGTAQVPSRSDSLTLRFPHAQIPCKGVPRYAAGRDGVRSCGAGRGLVREGAGKCPRAWGWAPPWGYP